jgi:DNA-3-methyladenine glycosylase II
MNNKETYFPYGEKEILYLGEQDERLKWAMHQIGPIQRVVEPDFFTSITRSIIGQQISTAAQSSIFNKLVAMVGSLTPQNVVSFTIEQLQSVGMTFRKSEYIYEIADKINTGVLDPSSFESMSDKEVIDALTDLKGVGKWTAEMLLIFCFMRPNIVSYGDLAIIRGIRMLYQLTNVSKKEFDHIVKNYSPYGSVASLYLWAISRGTIKELTDPFISSTKK